MTRTLRIPIVLALLGLVTFALPDDEATACRRRRQRCCYVVCCSANIQVQLPAEATLYIDDYRTSSTGPSRLYTTPPLAAGEYSYTLKAELHREGQPTVVKTEEVRVRPTLTAHVDFNDMGSSDLDLPELDPLPRPLPELRPLPPDLDSNTGQ